MRQGRFGRELVALAFSVVEADAAALPFADASFDLVVAFTSLMDFDHPDGAIRETARVLEACGRFCLHGPLEAWTNALHSAGFAIEALREHPYPRELWKDEAAERWTRFPLFLHVRAVKS